MYDNIFFILITGLALYYLIFKRNIRFIEIQSDAELENETENRSDKRDTSYCNDPRCVRCNLYRPIIDKAKDRLSKIKDDKSQIINKISESLSPFQSANDSFAQNPNIFFYRELQSRPFWDSNMFEESLILESRFDVIHSEFQKLLSEKDGIGWKRNETPNGSWEVFHLVNQGSVVELNSQRCPETMAVISELPAGMFKNVFGNVSFSVVHPSTVISEHYGPTNIKLRCHLGEWGRSYYPRTPEDTQGHWRTP